MNIELIAIEKIVPSATNPKLHPDEQVTKIASSIQEFGFDVPIVIEPDYTIIKGHGRYLAAKKLGLEVVPCIKSSLNKIQAKASRLIDNKVAESDWDIPMLKINIQELLAENYDNLDKYDFDVNVDNFLDDFESSSSDELLDSFGYDSQSHDTGKDKQYLKFAGKQVVLADDEIDLLTDKYNEYVEIYGSHIGFVRWLCG